MPRRLAVPLLLLAAAGCATFAEKTPTPAADLDGRELARLPKPPGERYYLLLFGSQDWTRRPAYTHTWATLVRAVDDPGGADPALEVHTISWLPVNGDITATSLRVEPGRNFSLEETIENCRRTGQEIAVWGAYEMWHGFFVRFTTQKAFLESGRVGYQMIDTAGEAGRTGNGCDCIHAISDMDPAYGRERYPLAFYGQPATAQLVRRLMNGGAVIDPPRTHDWVIPRLGLGEYPIERREYKGRVRPYRPGGAGLAEPPRPLLAPVTPVAPPAPTAPAAPRTPDAPPTPKTPAAPAKKP